MTFQEFIESAKQLTVGVDYPYLPSPKSPDSKKYKLIEVATELIKVQRDGTETTISIPHIKTLLQSMQKDVPVDVEKTLGSGGNTRSIEESILCLMPSIYYTRINNRKHIVESSTNSHPLGELTEWNREDVITEPKFKLEIPVYDNIITDDYEKALGKILAKEKTERKYAIHYFGLRFAKLIVDKKISKAKIVEEAKKLNPTVSENYDSELAKVIGIYELAKDEGFLKNISEVDDKEKKEGLFSFHFSTEIPTNFSFSQFPNQSPFSQQYIRSILAKPFVILTGNSGTGKTRIAKQFANYLGRFANENTEKKTPDNMLLLPVGADWTDNTKLLGFYNPLKKEYQSTPVLDFIILASQNPTIPFFLILDEMNLSHVERYFSDFLSSMESGEKIPLYKKDEECTSSIPEEIELPKNLFITGTVNIDETTYMFSPKVLDRANVIEFKPGMDEVLNNLLSNTYDGEQKTAEPGVAEGFMQLANKVRSGTIPQEVQPILEGIKPLLESVYKVLEKSGFEFAYRTAKEIRLYAIAAYKTSEIEKDLTDEELKKIATDIADIQILQKILPKIHGNKKQIGTLLDELETICAEKALEESKKKIQQMKDKLNRFQYASFI